MRVNGNLTFLTLGYGQLENAIIERLNSEGTPVNSGGLPANGGPGGPTLTEGRIVYNLYDNFYYYWNGTAWTAFSAGADTVMSFATGSSGLLASGTGGSNVSTPVYGSVSITGGALAATFGGTGTQQLLHPVSSYILVVVQHTHQQHYLQKQLQHSKLHCQDYYQVHQHQV